MNAVLLLVEESVKYASALAVSVEEETERHDHREYEEIVECLYLVRIERAEYHKETGKN